MFFNRAALCIDPGVGEVKTRGVECNLTRIDHFPGHTVNINSIEANKTCIECVDSLITIRVNIAMFIGNHEGATLADGDDRRSYFYFNGHFCVSLFVLLVPCRGPCGLSSLAKQAGAFKMMRDPF